MKTEKEIEDMRTKIFIMLIVFIVGICALYWFTPYYYTKVKYQNETVVLVFDDSTIGQYQYAYPILKQYNVNATFAVITGLVGTNQTFLNMSELSWRMVKIMKNGGMDIVSHTSTHLNLGDYYNGSELKYQLLGSREALNQSGIKTDILVLPYGNGFELPTTRMRLIQYYSFARGPVYDLSDLSNPLIDFNLNNGFNRYNIPSIEIGHDITLVQFEQYINHRTMNGKIYFLTYHDISNQNEANLLSQQLIWLKSQNIKTMTITQYLEG